VLYVALLLAQGQRRGYPWRQWLPLVATSTLALIVGCQLVALPPSDWLSWLWGNKATLLATVAAGPRSILGGATASLLAVVAVRRALGFRGWGVLDAFGAPLCWALAVQCVGCLLVGCCWGEPAASGWGVAYGPGTLPYLMQQARGTLAAGTVHALPLVPVQGYALLLCVGAGLTLHAVRRRAGWPQGSRYLLALGLLMLTRFIIDFWRDPASEPLVGQTLTLVGCTLLQVQWLMLVGAALALGSWVWLVRQPRAAPTPSVLATEGQPALLAIGLLVATTRLAPSALSAAETLILQALLLAVLLAEARAWLVPLGRQVPRLVGLPLGVWLGVALVGSTAQAPAPQQSPPLPEQDTPTKTIILSGGMLSNYHEAQEDILENNGGCSSSQPLLLQQRVRAAGGEIAVTTATSPTHSSTWGGGIWLGEQRVAIQTVPTSKYSFIPNDTTIRYFMSDIHLYKEAHFGHDWLSAGVRLGAHLGTLGYFSYFDSGNARSTAFLMPELMLSLGNPRLLYGQADFCYGAENTLGAYTTRFGLGSGLGQLHGSQLLAGYAHSPHYPSPNLAFVSASLRLPGGTGLGAVSLEPYFATDFAKHKLFSLKASYRLSK
jgi:prolipoprotein diacylglyceryltransferase